MAFHPQRHRRWVLASPARRADGENFRLEESEVPTPGPGRCCCAPFISR
jgi:hypothetical protein